MGTVARVTAGHPPNARDDQPNRLVAPGRAHDNSELHVVDPPCARQESREHRRSGAPHQAREAAAIGPAHARGVRGEEGRAARTSLRHRLELARSGSRPELGLRRGPIGVPRAACSSFALSCSAASARSGSRSPPTTSGVAYLRTDGAGWSATAAGTGRGSRTVSPHWPPAVAEPAPDEPKPPPPVPAPLPPPVTPPVLLPEPAEDDSPGAG